MGMIKEYLMECLEQGIEPFKTSYEHENYNSYNNYNNTRYNNYIDNETYVTVRFDNYFKEYTYKAPYNRTLKTGDRVRIVSNGEIKYVTVVRGNYDCPKKTDMYYKRLEIV